MTRGSLEKTPNVELCDAGMVHKTKEPGFNSSDDKHSPLGICCSVKSNNNLRAEGAAQWVAPLLTHMKSWLQSPTPYKPGMGAAYKPDTQEVETGGSRVPQTVQGVEGQAGLETLCERQIHQ